MAESEEKQSEGGISEPKTPEVSAAIKAKSPPKKASPKKKSAPKKKAVEKKKTTPANAGATVAAAAATTAAASSVSATTAKPASTAPVHRPPRAQGFWFKAGLFVAVVVVGFMMIRDFAHRQPLTQKASVKQVSVPSSGAYPGMAPGTPLNGTPPMMAPFGATPMAAPFGMNPPTPPAAPSMDGEQEEGTQAATPHTAPAPRDYSFQRGDARGYSDGRGDLRSDFSANMNGSTSNRANTYQQGGAGGYNTYRPYPNYPVAPYPYPYPYPIAPYPQNR